MFSILYLMCCIRLLSSFMFDVYDTYKHLSENTLLIPVWITGSFGVFVKLFPVGLSLSSHTQTRTQKQVIWWTDGTLDCDWQIQNMGLSLLFSHLEQEQDLNGTPLVSRNLLPAVSNDTLWPLNRPMTVRHWQAALQTSSQQNQ